MTTATTKKSKSKQPPTFRHFKSPVQAKKAKRAWVEKAKIRSKWKAEKRKLEGDDDERLDVATGQDNATHPHSSDNGGDAPLKAQQSASDRNAERDGREGKEGKWRPSERTSNQQNRPPRRPAPTSAGREETDKPQTTRGADDGSLRELFRKAYSRESLHTYKSDPLHRGKGRPPQHGGGTKRMGRGQPDMKLRMNALLEKIKRDVAAG